MTRSGGAPLATRSTLGAGLAALLLVAAVGALNLPYPFVADQVVSLYAARTLDAGGTLYVDFWDNKLPGLVWFHLAAGRLFGFDEVGVHTFELLWMLVFSVVLIVALAPKSELPWSAAFAPVAAVVTYMAAADSFQLTQLEILIGLPVFVAAWAAAATQRRPRVLAACYLVSGLAAGVTVTFKLVYAPLFPALWLVAAGYALVTGQQSLRSVVLAMALPATAGVLLVLGAVAAWFHHQGALYELYWTAFVYPPLALEAAPAAPAVRLATTAIFFGAYFFAWGVFVLVAVLDWWYGKRDLLFLLLLAWVVVGAGLLLIQRFSWWSYHALFLFPPIGIIGVRGACALPLRLLARGQIERAQCAVLALLLLLIPASSLAVPVSQKVLAYLEVSLVEGDDIAQLKRFVNRDYARIEQSVRFLERETARPGPIYVFGDPLYYWISGREPALPIMGWPWQYFLDAQWVHLPRQLDHVRPPYIYIDRDNLTMMEHRGGGVYEYIFSAYAPFASDAKGTWYQINPALLDR